MAPNCWVIYPLLKGSLEVRNTLGATPKSHPLAQVIPAFPADATLAAGYTNFQSNTVTDSEAADLRPDGHDRPRRFVSQRERSTST